MSQRLILPIKNMLVTAGYKNSVYQKTWGFVHYGLDSVSADADRTVYASGTGVIADCGQDGSALTGASARLGNVIAVIYRDVLCNDGKVRDVTCRMYHLDKILVRKGDSVTKDTALAVYGNTGAFTSGAHLHAEFDTDIQFPTIAPGISAGGQVINKAADVQKYGRVDSTLNPARVWFVGAEQRIAGRDYSGAKSYLPEDTALPKLPDAPQTPPSVVQPPKTTVAVYERIKTFATQKEAETFAVGRKEKTIIRVE